MRVMRVMMRVPTGIAPPLTCGDEGDEGDEGVFEIIRRAPAPAPTHAHTRPLITSKPPSSPSSPSSPRRRGEPVVRGGRAVTVDVEGVEVEHKMSVAKPGRKTARAYGLNTNHHVRVWCSCMDRPVNSPGTFAGQHATVVNERSQRQGANDPRRLGGWDWLGVADVREPGSALNLFRAHIREVSNG